VQSRVGGEELSTRRRSDAAACDPTPVRWSVVLAFFSGAVILECLLAWFIKSKEVGHPGDSVYYVVAAQAYLHLTPSVRGVVHIDLAKHVLFNGYLIGRALDTSAPFEPGMGLLLAPFIAAGYLYAGATFGVILASLAGLLLIHRRMTALTDLRPRGQLLLALLFAGPAVLLAVTQVYPDMISGVLLAAALVEVAHMEQARKVTWLNAVVIAVSAAFLPWLQIKNLVSAVVILVAFAMASRRQGRPRRVVPVIWAFGLLSWVVLLAYNENHFGHLLGLPEPNPTLSKKGVEFTLGLLFDRHQGLFAQVPFAVLGTLGLRMVRRKLPMAVAATVLSLGSILVLNGTYPHFYGGDSFAGRFMWTLLPALIAWTAIVITRWERAVRQLRLPFVVVTGAWIWEAVPILDRQHVYYNFRGTFLHAHILSAWPGWWPVLDRFLPQFDLYGHYLGIPAWTLPVELGLLGLLVIGAAQYPRLPSPGSRGDIR